MSGLQSETNPLRFNNKFYQPVHKKRLNFSRRNYPSNLQSRSPILDTPQPANIVKYVGQIEKVKPIHRLFAHNQLYYPDPEKSRQKRTNLFKTIGERNNSLGFLQHKTIQAQRDSFLKTFRAKSNKKQQMNLSFYNTTSKSKYIMQRFHKDECLTERSSPTFQNMLHRTIVINDILSKVKLNERKFVQGF